MYATPNQFLVQLSQLTCGIVTTTASNPGVRTSTPRTAQKIRLPRQVNLSTSAKQYVAKETFETIPETSVPIIPTKLSSLTSTTPEKHFFEPENDGLSLELTSKILLSSSPNFISDITQYFKSNPVLFNNFKFWEDIFAFAQPSSGIWESPIVKALFKDNTIKTYLSHLERSPGIDRASSPSFLTSYISSGSFELDKTFDVYKGFLQTTSQYNLVPRRTFKTYRNVNAESIRNPGLFARLRNKLFPMATPIHAAVQTSGSSVPQPQPNLQQQERLRALIANLPPDEASKMKVAFAEGYIAANPTQPVTQTRTYRWLRTLQQVLAIAVFTAILASLMGSFGSGMFRVNVGNGNEVQPEDINVTFADVKGVDEAKNELQEIVEFLRSPEKFVQLGGKLPKGVLLVGPPGTGKTLLARAVAGEAGVPFFHAAGPEFDEILVGQGARRVRDLFKAAKVKAPCVIFIDEIDSVGAKRTNSVLHPYANQTINQLLSEMDGFRQNEGVIVLGATNRREDLDRALLRPGRFDVEVQVAPPEYNGRKDILDYYLGRVKKGDDVDVDILARGTTGFTGADLENMVNQAALRAAIEGADRVLKKHLDFARDKVIMGPERRSRIPDAEANLITAYHEGGHALVAHYTKDSHPLHKVTIVARGHSLGHTAYIPEKERFHVTRSQLMGMMDTMMGGRAAEELIFGIEKITSGASSDLKQATAIASHMVKEWGMSEKVGLRTVEENNKSLVSVNSLGPQTNELMDAEIKRLLQESYERAKAILRLHNKEHIALAEALIKYETLDADDVKAIMSGEKQPLNGKKPAQSAPPTPPTPSTTISIMIPKPTAELGVKEPKLKC